MVRTEMATKLRVDLRPFFPKIANYYWDERDLSGKHLTIWDWLKRDYDVVKIGSMGSKPELWVSFPDEQSLTFFLLRWA
jgi:hypothetical protein